MASKRQEWLDFVSTFKDFDDYRLPGKREGKPGRINYAALSAAYRQGKGKRPRGSRTGDNPWNNYVKANAHRFRVGNKINFSALGKEYRARVGLQGRPGPKKYYTQAISDFRSQNLPGPLHPYWQNQLYTNATKTFRVPKSNRTVTRDKYVMIRKGGRPRKCWQSGRIVNSGVNAQGNYFTVDETGKDCSPLEFGYGQFMQGGAPPIKPKKRRGRRSAKNILFT